MLFDYGDVDSTKRVLVHGGGGNVGAYAVQLAKRVAREVIATAWPAGDEPPHADLGDNSRVGPPGVFEPFQENP